MIYILEYIYLIFILVFTLIFPGIIVLPFFHRSKDWKIFIPIIPALSMAVNGFLYWILYLIGIYTRTSVFILWIVYIGLFVFLWISLNRNKKIKNDNLKSDYILNENHHNYLPGTGKIDKFIHYFVVFVITFFFIFYTLSTLSTPFKSWDAVVSWNSWAVDIASMKFIGGYQFGYPQLMPLLFSVNYKMNIFDDVFILNNAQFINHFYVLLFTIIICLILYYFSKLKNINPLLSVLLLLSNFAFIMQMTWGYTDILPGIFLIGLLYLIFIFTKINKNIKNLSTVNIILFLLMSILASASAFAKQSGLYVIIFFIIWVIYIFIKNKCFNYKVFLVIIIPILLAGSFYVREVLLSKNVLKNDDSAYNHSIDMVSNTKSLIGYNYENRYLTLMREYEGDHSLVIESKDISFLKKSELRLHEYSYGFNPWFMSRWDELFRSKKNPFIFLIKIIVISSIMLGLIKKEERLKSIFILCVFFSWLFTYGYDIRHMFFIYPLIAFVIALFLDWICRKKVIINRIMLVLVLALFILNNRSLMIGNDINPKYLISNFTNMVTLSKNDKIQKFFPIEYKVIKIIKDSKEYEEGKTVIYAIGYLKELFPNTTDHITSDTNLDFMKIGDFYVPFDDGEEEILLNNYYSKNGYKLILVESTDSDYYKKVYIKGK